MTPGLGITIERMAHYEGVADQSHYGFVSASSARLETVNTPLDLIAKYNVHMIFSTYDSRRTALIEEILRGHVITGFWSETLFPSIKDLVRYGADYLQADDKVGTMVKAGVDTAAATLGALYPQLIPYLSIASQQLGDAAQKMSRDAVEKVKQWSNVRGLPGLPHGPKLAPHDIADYDMMSYHSRNLYDKEDDVDTLSHIGRY